MPILLLVAVIVMFKALGPYVGVAALFAVWMVVSCLLPFRRCGTCEGSGLFITDGGSCGPCLSCTGSGLHRTVGAHVATWLHLPVRKMKARIR
jgi:hypothetical protein